MASDRDWFDVVSVGAGVAGLAAAQTAAAAGARTVVLEAKPRIGGRAFTDTNSLGVAFDHGCHWFHSASENPLAAIALGQGQRFETEPLRLEIFVDGHAAGVDGAEQWRRYADTQIERIDRAAQDGKRVSAADIISPDGRWDTLFRGWFAMLNGVEPEQVCALDHARYHDTDENWVLPSGYGNFIAEHFGAVPVRMSTPVDRIVIGKAGVEIGTKQGVVHARTVVITVSTAVLQQGLIDFQPRLSPHKRAAIGALPLGFAEKAGLLLGPSCKAFSNDPHTLFSAVGDDAISLRIRPHGWPIVSAYFGGRFAAACARQGPGALTRAAQRHLAINGAQELADAVVASVESAWTIDPHVLGSYSAAFPGGDTNARLTLGEPMHGRVFFAGEATSPHAYSTAHGAYESGLRAAREALSATGLGLG